MTQYERNEIQEYKEIYFMGLDAEKISGSPMLSHNYGFDDERGDYKIKENTLRTDK